jgi:hypothetical protein
LPGAVCKLQNNDLKEHLTRYPTDQDQHHWQEVRENNLDSCPGLCWKAKSSFCCPRGSDTQWYKNVLQNWSIRVVARGMEAESRAVPITDAKMVKSVVEN